MRDVNLLHPDEREEMARGRHERTSVGVAALVLCLLCLYVAVFL